jgi:WD40 repeat protein
MRFLSVMRLPLVILFAFVGLCWLSLLNGQVLTNTLGCLACVVIALFVSLSAARDQELSRRLRALWWLTASLFTLLAVGVAGQLSHSRNINLQQAVKALREHIERDRRRIAVGHKAQITLDGYRGSLGRLRLSADGKLLASAGGEDGVKVRDVASGKELLALPGTWLEAITGDGRMLACSDRHKTIILWDITTGKQHAKLQWVDGVPLQDAGSSELWHAEFSADGKTLASGHSDQLIRLWDVATGQERSAFRGQPGVLCALAFSPDGKRLAAASFRLQEANKSAGLKVWNIETGREIVDLPSPEQVCGLAFTADGQILASSGVGGPFRLWDLTSGKEICRFGDESLSYALAFTQNGNRLLTVRHDGAVITVWDVPGQREQCTLVVNAEDSSDAALSADGQWLAVATRGLVKLWNIADPCDHKASQ